MSRSTETIHIKDADRAAVLTAIKDRMASLGFVPSASPLSDARDTEREALLRADPPQRCVALRKDGEWISIADEDGFTGTGALGGLNAWGIHLSRTLRRAVLTIMTWDAEAAVSATRWEDGIAQCTLELLSEAKWGDDGRPYAPARVLEPWLPVATAKAILKTGIKLEHPVDGTTAVRVDSDDEDEIDDPYVSEMVSVAAIGAAIGMARPAVHPWEPEDGDEALLFYRAGTAA